MLAFFMRGQVYLAEEDPDKALADFNQAIRLFPMLLGPRMVMSGFYRSLRGQ
jgi:hypothetical protein